MTPYANVGGKWLGESLHILEALRKAFPAVREFMAREGMLPPQICDGTELMRHWYSVQLKEPQSAAAEDAIERWLEAVEVVNKHLVFQGPFLCGENLGAADFELGPLLASQLLQARVWYGVDPGEVCPALETYLERLKIRQAYENSDIDDCMHLLYTLDKLVKRNPSERLSNEAIASMRAAIREEQKSEPKQNFCL